MFQYEISIGCEFSEGLIKELATETKIRYDKKKLIQCIHEKDSKSKNNLYVLSNEQYKIIVDCNNNDWLYTLIIIGKNDIENQQINSILLKWDNICRKEYGQKRKEKISNVYGMKNTLLEKVCYFYKINIL